jgi:pimeloyl-ACP methyl ester carboxylesterase
MSPDFPSKTDRKPHFIKYTALGLGGLALLYAGLSAFGAKVSMEVPRLPVKGSPDDVGLAYEDAAFPSRDGAAELRGWFLPAAGNTAILIVHGGFENRVDENVDTLGMCRDLVAKGYPVLTFDLRGRGDSGGKGLALSHIDPDIGGAMDYLAGRGYPPEKVCILGFCSGAASACLYASRNSVGALVLDGCFIDVPTMVAREAASVGPPEFLARAFVPGLRLMTRLLYGYHMVNPIDVIGNVACPILFIREEHDQFITWDETLRLYKASANPAYETWEVKGALHSQAWRTGPQAFIDRIDAFISKTIS